MSPELKPIVEAIKSGNKEKARDYLRPLMKKNPTADVMYLASLVALNPKQAKQFLEQALTIDPFHELANRAIEKLTLEAVNQDTELVSKLQVHREAEQYFNLGVSYENKGNFDSAHEAYSEAIRLYPEYSEAYYRRSGIHYQKLGLVECISDYEASVRLNPPLSNVNPKKYAVLYFNLAEFHAELEFHGPANNSGYHQPIVDKYLAIASSLYPDLAVVHAYRAFWKSLRLTYSNNSEESQWRQVIADANEAIRINPEIPCAYNARDTAKHALSIECESDDMQYIDEILHGNHVPTLIDETGEFYFARGDARLDEAESYENRDDFHRKLAQDVGHFNENTSYRAAISDLTLAIRINPLRAMPYFRRGDAWFQLGDFESALHDFEIAKTLGLTTEDVDRGIGFAHFNLGVQSQNLLNVDTAISHYSSSLQVLPDYFESRLLRSQMLIVKATSTNSSKYLREALNDLAGCANDLRNLVIYYKDKNLVPYIPPKQAQLDSLAKIQELVTLILDSNDYSSIEVIHQEIQIILKIRQQGQN